MFLHIPLLSEKDKVFEDNFCYFSIKINVVDTHSNHLGEVILMSIHNILFNGELKKIIL